jgi:hypothetical protein
MTGYNDSTPGFQAAVSALISNIASGTVGTSSSNYGGCISIPPGVLKISSPIIFACASVLNGPCAGIYGAGTQNTTILQITSTSDVFEGCQTANSSVNPKGATSAGYAPNMSAPGTPCPLTPSSSNNQSGLVFANLTVAYSTQASPAPPPCSNTSLCGKAPSVWSFPNIGGLIIQDVDVVNGDNCIDAGFANFVKVQGPGDGPPGGSTTEFQCSGDFFAAHGGEGTILIDKVSWKGGRGTGVGNGGLGQGIFMDFTDLNASRYLATANTTITTITSSDLEGAAWGFLDFADANTLIADTTVSDTICDGFTFSCLAFYSVPNYIVGVGASQHLSVDDTKRVDVVG